MVVLCVAVQPLKGTRKLVVTDIMDVAKIEQTVMSVDIVLLHMDCNES